MLTKSDIRKAANTASYSKGVDIFLSNRIEEFTVEEDGAFDDIRAVVKGSGRNRYDVDVVYDLENDRMEDISCACPAFSKYSGICKHCVAVMLKYLGHIETKRAGMEKEYKKETSLARLQALKGMPPKNPPVQTPPVQKPSAQKLPVPQMKAQATTPAMKQLLAKRLMKKTLPLIPDSVHGKVRIEPMLKCDTNGIEAEFKIGAGQMYILKDVFAFAEALEKNESVSYGKKLQFVHTLEAFDPDYRPLVKFIRSWVQNNRIHYMQTSYYSHPFGYVHPRLRLLPLSGGEVEDFLDAMGSRPFFADVTGKGEKSWKVTEEALAREMSVRRKGSGIKVKIDSVFGYQCDRDYIYFEKGSVYRVQQEKMEGIRDFLTCMADIPGHKVYIQKEDIPAFSRELLPALEEFYVCTKTDFDEKDYGVVPVSFEIYVDAPQRDFITFQILAVYGEKKYNIYNDTDDVPQRDLTAEMEVGNAVSFFCNAYDEKEKLMVLAEDEDRIYELLVNGIPRMQDLAQVYISDALKRMKVTAAPKVAVGISVSGELLELSMTSEEMPGDQLMEILSKYNRKKKFYRLKSGEFVNIEGEEIEALFELRQGLNLSASQLKNTTIEIPKYRALYLDAELKERNSLPAVKDKEFKALVRNMKTVEDNDFDIPEGMGKILREYQKRGFLWIKTIRYNGFGGILADDMGLGKTLQVICFLMSEYRESQIQDNRRSLVVCPASLVFNWKSEIEKFAPELPVKMVIGTAAERREMLENMGNREILVTSFDLLKRDISHYEKIRFHAQIIDEAQFIKNHNTQAAKAVKQVNAGFRLALTGTPIENRLSELWSIFDYLMPGFLYTYQRFRDELEIPIVLNQEETAIRRLQKMIAPFVLRRLKKEVLTDLPDKLEENVFAKLEGEQQKLYDAHVKKLKLMLEKESDEELKKSKIQILAELTKLRQICCDPALLYEEYQKGSAKTEMCMDLIQNAISGGHKILIFSQFTSMLKNLQKRLQKEDIRFYSLTGADSKESRADMVARFNKDDTPVFCISLKAGGTGLNLTSADIVIHFDPWWNSAVQNQATDRAHRIGQKNVVSVYRLIVKDTIEENIVKIQEKKKELADQVFSGEGMGGVGFTREDLLELLR